MCVCGCAYLIAQLPVWARERERVIALNTVTFQLVPGVWARQRHERLRDSQLAFCSICFNLFCSPSILIYLSFPHTFFSCFFSFFLYLFNAIPISSPLTFQFLCPNSCLPKRRIIYSKRGLFKLNWSIPHRCGVWEKELFWHHTGLFLTALLQCVMNSWLTGTLNDKDCLITACFYAITRWT